MRSRFTQAALATVALAMMIALGSGSPCDAAEAEAALARPLPPPVAAGMIPFTRIGGDVYLLLAGHLHDDRGWATFGGEMQTGETPLEGALREMNEETACRFKREELAAKSGPALRDGGYVAWVVEVPYRPAQVFNRPPSAQCVDADERGPWAWVPLSAVRPLLSASSPRLLPEEYVPHGERRDLWDEGVATLRQAVERGLLR